MRGLTRFGVDKPVKAGPGRPKILPEVRKERLDAREILRNAAPHMAARIAELAHSEDPDIAIKAIKVGLDKVLPNLEEVETFEHRPLIQLTDEQIDAKLAELNAGASSVIVGETETP